MLREDAPILDLPKDELPSPMSSSATNPSTMKSAPSVISPAPDTTYDHDPILKHDSMIRHSGEDWDAPATPWSSGDWFNNGCSYAEIDFFFARRNRPDDRTALAIDVSSSSTGSVVDIHRFFTYSQPFGIEPGVRLTYGRFLGRDYLNRDHAAEFTFYGVNEFATSDGIRSRLSDSIVLNTLVPTNIAAGFGNADTYTADHTTNMMGFELNYKIKQRLQRDRMLMGPDGSWTRQYNQGHVPSFFAGLRYFQYNEEYLLRSRRDNVDTDVYSGDYNVRTTNDLLGLQIGAECYDQYETWYWGAKVKAGAYANFADQQSYVSVNNTLLRDENASIGNAAFLGELNLVAAYHLSPNWTLKASYDFMWIAGLAYAPDQIRFDVSQPDIKVDGFLFTQAVSLGTEFVW
jgi:hypothetical protein